MLLHHDIEGEGPLPPVLFLHGFMGRGADWHEVAAALRGHARCITVDLPGHGASTGLAPAAYTFDGVLQALCDVLDARGVPRCAVVGYSMGGRLALAFALRHPARCRRLLLESASPGLRTEGEREARRRLDEERAGLLETGDLAAFVAEWYRQPLFQSLPDGLRARLEAARRANDPRELARALRGLGTGVQPSLWDDVCTLALPTLAVAGAHDGAYVDVVRRLGVLNAMIRTAIIPNAGHNLHAEQPTAFAELLLAFLRSPSPEDVPDPG